MERRNFLIGMGAASAGGGIVLGSGAFSRVESDRYMMIEVAEDPDAYLGLDACDSAHGDNYVEIDDYGHLYVDIGESGNGGEGVNSNSQTWFDDVFQICNQGKEDAHVYIEADDDWPTVDSGPHEGDPRVDFYVGEDDDESILGEDNALELGLGECECIGIKTNTHGLDATDVDSLLEDIDDTITIVAQAEAPAPPVDEAFFEVSDLDPMEATVEQGDLIDVSATITNTGDAAGEQDVELRINGDAIDSQSLALDPDDSEMVVFEDVDTSDLEEGEYTHSIATENDEQSGTLTVGEPDDVLGEDPALLVFSVTDGFRHANIEEGNARIQAMGTEIIDAFPGETEAEEVRVDVIDDPGGDASEFPSDVEELQQYDAVIWNSTTGSPLDSAQQAAFRQYLEAGGGYAGVHAASDTHYDWEWYGDEVVGAYFAGHPSGANQIQTANLYVEDRVHPSTEFLPAIWERADEWYDFNRNPRGDFHILATIDEDTYEEAAMTDGRIDHPIAWCRHVEVGRSWYTAGGHTHESWEEDDFVEHVMKGIMWSAGWLEGDASATVWDSYEQVELAGPDDLKTGNQEGPMSMTIVPDGRVFFVERQADVSVIDPDTFQVSTALEKDFWFNLEDGGLGIAADPDFEDNNWIYLYYSPVDDELDPEDDMPYNQLSRFTVEGDELDPDSEVEMLRVHTQRQSCCHSAGDLQFGPDGSLFLSTGDNVTPFESNGFAPIDERTTDPNTADAQGTSGDTSDLRGSILRIVPEEDGSYSIPDDNLKAQWEAETSESFSDDEFRPEIFAMGFRNPFRFDVDSETGWVYMADYGPDSGSWSADRGPIGIREYNQIREPGNYGWPFTRARNYPYIDYDFETGESIVPFDPENLINDSVNNHGIEEIPPAQESTFYVPTSWNNYLNAPSPDDHDWGDIWDVPDLAPYPEVTDRAPNGGPLVRLPADRADGALPPYFEGKWIIAEWNNGNFLQVTFGDDGELLEISDWSPNLEVRDLASPHDMEIGPNGRFYYIEWGDGFSGDNPGIYRLEYIPEVEGRVSLSLSLGDDSLAPGESTTATATLTNTTDSDIEDVEIDAMVDSDYIDISTVDETSLGTLGAGSSASVEWDVTVDAEAPSDSYNIVVEVMYVDAEGEDQQLTQATSLTVEEPEPLSVPYGIDSGGEDHDDVVTVGGLEFDKLPNDSVTQLGAHNTASVYGEGFEIDGTDDQLLYETEHWGGDIGYEIELPNGTYDVTLHFAEIWWGIDGRGGAGNTTGERVFDVSIQGEEVLSDYDIYDEVGSLTATTETIEDVEVTDETLTIESVTHEDNTKFSGIEIQFAEPVQEGLEAYFPLNDEEPTNEITGNNAEIVGSPTPGAEGVVDEAWEFDIAGEVGPVEDALVSEPLPLNGEGATAGAWMNATDFEEWARAPFQIGGSPEDFPQAGWDVEWDQNNSAIIGQIADNGSPGRSASDGTISLDLDTWYFVAMVVEGDSYRIHAFDQGGELDDSPITGSGTRTQSDEEPIVMMTADGRGTEGRLDSLWAYSRALDETEVDQLYAQSLEGLDPDDDEPTVTVATHPDHGDILADADGNTLYMFDVDEQGAGESGCTDGCADAWPPLTVDDEPIAGDGVAADLTTFERDDGSMQVAANGWPLYYFDGDEEPGDANGQGVNDVWWVLDPAGEPIRDDGVPDGVIEPGTTIDLDGQTPGWIGLAPEEIEGEENPTIILAEGEEYTLGWSQGDGAFHNIAIRDEGASVVDDLQTSVTNEPDEDQFLTFTASEEMVEYVCQPHAGTMVGEIDVV